MALNLAPFLGLAATTKLTAGSSTLTYTFEASALPYGAVRITNLGTAMAFIQFIDTSNTVTVGVTNSQPIITTSSVVLSSGGKQAMAYIATTGTFTTSIYVTAGQGGMAE